MQMTRRACGLVASGLVSILLCIGTARAQEDPFAAGVRPTGAKTPDDERKAFHLPPGFKIELFAAEPDIQKPMNLAFDARGRLWVSGSVEYPFPAPLDRKGRDSIRILEDTDHDGKADKTTVFADGLNIPIGLYPYKNGVIAFSIPNIYFFEDTDGDDHADRREVLYGPLGYERDAHGLNNAFRRGFDGWLYADHGYNNNTTIKAKDGSRIDVNSGNTYRIRVDGARVEQFTYGQVNPFGLSFDPYGDLYSADCHTKPLMLLLRGGYYDSFGKPHNGLGYVPSVMEHLHGSTAIAGVACYTGGNFPQAYRGNMFTGNVMTSRVNRDSIRRIGSSVQAIEEPDFISTDDPWFRPVDLRIGPDGAMYVADFYNKIIGHYEVPLTHPGRDRTRGRIWRVSYVGDEAKPAVESPSPNLRSAGVADLIAAFDHPVLDVRMRAADEIADRIGKEAQEPVRAALKNRSAGVRALALWTLYRIGSIGRDEVLAAGIDSDGLVRVHAMRVLSETFPWDKELDSLAVAGLRDREPLVQRTAADALGRHPNEQDVSTLLNVYQKTPEADVHLRHTILMALLENAKVPGTLTHWQNGKPSSADLDLMAIVALALPTEESGAFLIERIGQNPPPAPKLLIRMLTHAAKYLPRDANVKTLADLSKKVGDLDLQLDLFLAVQGGLQQRGQGEPKALRTWGSSLAHELVDSLGKAKTDWFATDLNGGPSLAWRLERRQSADDGHETSFLSSLPLGEPYTGVVRSRAFTLPATLSLFVCGHLGNPPGPTTPRNLVRLRLAGSNKVLHEAQAPGNDVAQKVTWDLANVAGKLGYIEVIDQIKDNAYAWIAIARIEPPVVALPALDAALVARRQEAVARIAGTLDLRELEEMIKKIAVDANADPAARVAAARTLAGFHPDPVRMALVGIASDPSIPAAARDAIVADIAEPAKPAPAARDLLAKVAKDLPLRLQTILATALAETKEGGERLLGLVEEGAISARILQHPAIRGSLFSTHVDHSLDRIEKLTSSLPALAEQTQKLIDARKASFGRANASLDRGKLVFEKQCSACHQVAGKGVVVGPQLDGIGSRGMERIVEDILDPNRNVDPNFYATQFALNDGRVISGLFRRKEGANVILVDSLGKEITIAETDVDERKTTKLSPMPADFGNTLTESELHDLLKYLLVQEKK